LTISASQSLLKCSIGCENARYVGRTFVKGGGKPMDILEKLNEMAGFAPNEEIQLFEV
jgi:ubiquitin carboxyl-terminal hydrolase 7